MKHLSTTALLLLLAGLLIAPTMMADGNKRGTVSAADRRKAEYIFLNAQRAKEEGRSDAFFEQINYAHHIDPTNSAISFYMGSAIINMISATIDDGYEALALMKEHYEDAPDDFYETTFYSDANMLISDYAEAVRALSTLNSRNPNRYEIMLRLAQAYQRADSLKQAIKVLDAIEVMNDRSFETTREKIYCYLVLSDTATALREMRQMLYTAPHNARYNIHMATLLQIVGQPDSAAYYLDRAVEYEPDNGQTYIARAGFYDMVGDSSAVEREINRAILCQDLDMPTKIDLVKQYVGRVIMSGDSTRRADDIFEALVEQHPLEPMIRKYYGNYLIFIDDYDKAVEQFNYSLDLAPDDLESWQRLMTAHMLNENYPAAIAAGDRALELNPDSVMLYGIIAPAYYQMKAYDKAIETYNKALAIVDSTEVDMRSSLIGGIADAYYSMGDTIKAFDTYEEALRVAPDNVSVMNNYAYFLAESDRELDKAESLASRAVNADPDNATFLDTYAWVFFKKQDYATALLYMKLIFENTEDDDLEAEEMEHYGDILFMNGKPDEAVKQWERALELDSDNELLQRKVKNRTYFYK